MKTFATCLAGCGWAHDGDDVRAVDKAAEKHTEQTGHTTNVRGWAEEER